MLAAILTGTTGIVALAAAAVAALAVVWCALLTRSMRKLRHAQRLVLGDSGQADIVAHSASLQEAFGALQDYVADVAERIDGRLAGAEDVLAGAIKHRALVRYDAYNELSGQQSVSIALLDDRRCGVVLSCIHHRDQARVYAKQVHEGQSELELSPEESQALEEALRRPPAGDAGQWGPAGRSQDAGEASQAQDADGAGR